MGPYYLAQRTLSSQTNAVAPATLLSTYCVFKEILLDYFKTYHQILPDPETEQILMLLPSDILTHDLKDINI